MKTSSLRMRLLSMFLISRGVIEILYLSKEKKLNDCDGVYPVVFFFPHVPRSPLFLRVCYPPP
jgi:hypothetical protein